MKSSERALEVRIFSDGRAVISEAVGLLTSYLGSLREDPLPDRVLWPWSQSYLQGATCKGPGELSADPPGQIPLAEPPWQNRFSQMV